MKSVITILAVVLLIPACGGKVYQLQIDGYADRSKMANIGKSYILFPANEEANGNQLRFIEFANQIESALQPKGYIRTETIEDADIVIAVSYGIGNPQQQAIPFTPITPSTQPSGNGFWDNFRRSYIESYNAAGKVSAGDRTTYSRFLVLQAFDLKSTVKTGSIVPLWSNIVTSRGTSGDLRIVFPFLVSGSKYYWTMDTGKQIMVNVDAP